MTGGEIGVEEGERTIVRGRRVVEKTNPGTERVPKPRTTRDVDLIKGGTSSVTTSESGFSRCGDWVVVDLIVKDDKEKK